MQLPRTMRAARYPTAGERAGAIEIARVARPDPRPGEVLVRVAVSGVNPTDWKSRENLAGPVRHVIPHHDGAGVIVAVGAGVLEERIGERVWIWQAQWQRDSGTAAEYVPVPHRQAVPLSSGVGFDHAAGLGIPAMTAYHCLFKDGQLDETQQVLIHGGAGAVGHAAIQLASHAGARVATTVSSPEKAQLAASAGAELVVDYKKNSVVDRIRTWAKAGVARIVEVDLAANLESDAQLLAPGGSILVYARTEVPVRPTWELMSKNARVEFMLIYTVPNFAKFAAVRGISRALDDGALFALPTTRFRLEETARAHEAVRDGAVGKVLVDVAP